ncbi:hypothetical protein, partial [Vibrio parahaemolyticus]
ASENTKASLMLAFLIGFHFKNVKKSMKNEAYCFAISFFTITAAATMNAMIRPSSMNYPNSYKKIYDLN